MTDEWWRDAVVYQVYPRSFAGSDGDGRGDLPGVTARLEHLSDLGVDALWLSPLSPSAQADAATTSLTTALSIRASERSPTRTR